VTLREIPSATEVFVDANIFVYHFSGPSELTPACSAFLRRIENHDLEGFTSHIATNDPDFERVESLKVWKPAPSSPSA